MLCVTGSGDVSTVSQSNNADIHSLYICIFHIVLSFQVVASSKLLAHILYTGCSFPNIIIDVVIVLVLLTVVVAAAVERVVVVVVVYM